MSEVWPRHSQKSRKIQEIYEKTQKSEKIQENLGKSMKIQEIYVESSRVAIAREDRHATSASPALCAAEAQAHGTRSLRTP